MHGRLRRCEQTGRVLEPFDFGCVPHWIKEERGSESNQAIMQ